jgi:ATP-dependent DNA helicase RecG
LHRGEAAVVVGTHALIQDAVRFGAPGLVVIDEQHRFGVEQRRTLREAGESTDALVMSATPIPRSMALTLYGDLDLSVLDEMPPGRTPVKTGVRGETSREAAFDFLKEQLEQGRQGYIVYPLIDESEVLDVKAATLMHERLVERFSGFDVGLIHGRLAAAEKEGVMRRFVGGEVQLLVSTTVIEVGIDVPNATVMFIEDAERFGLAQLHQLRGRVGRGEHASYCAAFYSGKEPPERLEIFARTTDGFELARADLRLRGQLRVGASRPPPARPGEPLRRAAARGARAPVRRSGKGRRSSRARMAPGARDRRGGSRASRSATSPVRARTG